MNVLNLQARIRQKRKFSSHKGDIGKKADNLIQRQFEASKPMEKCYTDVTEFAIPARSKKTLFVASILTPKSQKFKQFIYDEVFSNDKLEE